VVGHSGKITLEKQWSRTPQSYALQVIKKDILVHDPGFAQYRTVEELFPEGSSAFMLGHPLYGRRGLVLTAGNPGHRGRIQLRFEDLEEPDISHAVALEKEAGAYGRFAPGYRAANSLGVSAHLLSRITGTVFVNKSPREAEPDRQSRINVGLNLKVNSKFFSLS